jgi:hypothetical protein
MTLDTPHTRLRKLKNQLYLSTTEQETQLLLQYLALCKMPKRANIKSWLGSWEELLKLMAAAKMPELRGTRAQQDFLDLVQLTDNSWATSQRISMIAKQEMRKSFMSVAGLIGQFLLYYRQMKPVASMLGSFTALGNAQQSQPSKDSDKPQQMICLCRETHFFLDRLYVNPAKQSSS